ncbi:MAG: DNA mismatch repair endonuclease MutL, partial [SAR324 cluster bacterium]|nr:DNA mismatch repair endonuclease MutL [SAR324 cluster bacterium]
SMQIIHILPEALINKIAAGEVVERPASAVKELVENALDAGSDQILITVKNGGKDFISVLDNGSGMSSEDAQLAIERHATSKVKTSEDLERISTMGFRGEALAAIAAVSRFEMTTCHNEVDGGFQVRVEGGKRIHSARVGFPVGTRIVIENLFFNTPARQKFMKSTNTEYNHIHDLIIRLALGHPQIQFKLIHNKNVVLNLPKGQTFADRVEHCFGSEIAADLIPCQHEESYLSYEGLISRPSGNRTSKRWQHVFINDRHVKCQTINHGIYEGYKTLMMKNMHPLFFIKVNLPPSEIDVNVHPAKTEIRLKNQNLIHTIFAEKIASQLKGGSRKQIFGSTSRELHDDSKPVRTEKEISTAKKSDVQLEEKAGIFIETSEQIGFFKADNQLKPNRSVKKITDDNTVDPFSFSESERTTSSPPVSETFEQQQAPQVIGQLLNKYILAQGEENLILVDQHAAHERIRFEEIRDHFYNRTLDSHPLLIPIMMELPPQDGLLLDQNQDSWKKLGFVIDHFGGNDYSIKEIPVILKDSDVSQVIRDVLDEMAQFGKSGKLEGFFNEVFERMACHSAIRAAQHLSFPEMQALLDQLSTLDLQLYCPHGRPVLIEISLSELDKRFKRIL